MGSLDDAWSERLNALESLRQEVESWPSDLPNLDAARCEFSRHRTLAHLRACQEIWLAAVIAFAEKENSRVKLPHPWRQFESMAYQTTPWDEHKSKYLADRAAWMEILLRPGLDPDRGGKLSGKPCTIGSLTDKLIGHDRHHLAVLWQTP